MPLIYAMQITMQHRVARMQLTTKGVAASQVQKAHVLLNEVQAAIVRHKGGNLLPVLDQLDTRALPDSRVGLLGLNTAAHGHYTVRSQIKA